MIDTVTLHDDQNLIDYSCNYYSIEDFNNKFNPKSKQTPKNSDNYIDYFSLLHINARSLNKFFDAIELFRTSVKEFSFSVIGITETWLNSNSPCNNVPFYKTMNSYIRADRSHGKGGGVGIIHKHNQLKFKLRPDLHISGSEDIFLEIINSKSKNIIFGTIYGPPPPPTMKSIYSYMILMRVYTKYFKKTKTFI